MIATSDGFHLGHEWHPQCRDGSIAVGRLSESSSEAAISSSFEDWISGIC